MKDNNTIFVNARFLTQPITGVQRYALEVCRELKKSNKNIVFLTPKNILHTSLAQELGVKVVGIFKGHLWEQFELPFYSKRGVLFNPCATGPLFKRNQVSTFHDSNFLVFPKGFSFGFRLWYSMIFNVCGFLSKKIITISNYSKDELVKNFAIKNSKIKVIYEGFQHFNTIKPDFEIITKVDSTKPFFLAVGSINKNKNFSLITESLKYIENGNYSLVIVGGKDDKVFGKSDTSHENVIMLGRVSDEELKALYLKALCFIFPSFYEGFGLPPMEALSCGCPIIISNTSALPEVYKDAALYCDPHDSQNLANRMEFIINNQNYRYSDTFINNKDQILQMYSWGKCAMETLEVIIER